MQARKTYKERNMKVTVAPVVIGVPGTIVKGLVKGLEVLEIGGEAETIQTAILLRDSSERPSPSALVKKKS